MRKRLTCRHRKGFDMKVTDGASYKRTLGYAMGLDAHEKTVFHEADVLDNMIEEAALLSIRYDKLNAFIGDYAKDSSRNGDVETLLKKQYSHMGAYLGTLIHRIGREVVSRDKKARKAGHDR